MTSKLSWGLHISLAQEVPRVDRKPVDWQCVSVFSSYQCMDHWVTSRLRFVLPSSLMRHSWGLVVVLKIEW